GGTGASEGNLIAKNLDGIQISGGSQFVTVQGNTIRNNSQSGIRVEGSSNNLIGGNTVVNNINVATNNIFNRRLPLIDTTFTVDGVFIVAGLVGGINTPSEANTVQGNIIGTDAVNTTGLGLTGNGILIDGSKNNKIGITSTLTAGNVSTLAAAEGNVIAFNAFNGIAVVEGTFPGKAFGNTLSGNSIFNNNRLGIDLGSTAGVVTPNGAQDGDAGPNNPPNIPVVVLAQSQSGTGTRIQGTLNSTPGRSFRVEFFLIDTPNPTGTPPNYGQGKTFVGFSNVTTDPTTGDVGFTFINSSLVLPA